MYSSQTLSVKLWATPRRNSARLRTPSSCLLIAFWSRVFKSAYFLAGFWTSCPEMNAVNSAKLSASSFWRTRKKRQIEGCGFSTWVCIAQCHPSNLLLVLGSPSTVRRRTFQESIKKFSTRFLFRFLNNNHHLEPSKSFHTTLEFDCNSQKWTSSYGVDTSAFVTSCCGELALLSLTIVTLAQLLH